MAMPKTSTQDAIGEVADIVGSTNAELIVSDIDSTAASSDVCVLLCATRKRMGKDLLQVSKALCIRFNYLVAIEDGRYEDLPGQAYAVGFVRSYAEYLGLDGAEIIRRYKEDNSVIRRKLRFDFPIPMTDSVLPSSTLLLLAVMFGTAIYGAWYAIAASERGAVELIQEVPSRLAPLLGRGNL